MGFFMEQFTVLGKNTHNFLMTQKVIKYKANGTCFANILNYVCKCGLFVAGLLAILNGWAYKNPNNVLRPKMGHCVALFWGCRGGGK